MSDHKRTQEAKDKANDYQNRELQPGSGATPPSLDHWTDLVGQRIEEAMRQGQFDNLPGQGKPLKLSKDPFTPDDMQMANKLLANNQLTPAWIDARKQIQTEIAAFRTKLATTTAAYAQALHSTDPSGHPAVRRQWHAQIEIWRTEVQALNRRIDVVNLQQPVRHLELFKLLLDEELDRVGGGALAD